MEQKNKAVIGLSLTLLSGLALFGWTHSTPVMAQDADTVKPITGAPGKTMMMDGGSSLAASGDYVYVLRGNVVYQMKSSDLSLVTQKELPSAQAVKP